MHKLPFFVLLASALFLSACSSGGSDSPSDSDAHPQNWFSTHGQEARVDPGYNDCTACHGPDLLGSGEAVSCFSCHSYKAEPPFTIHPLPPTWTNAFIDHRGFAALNGTTTCNACHGQDLRGRQTAPSCFSTGFDGRSCHADGPQGVPHLLNGSYLSGANHGPDAKADLVSCQSCHGQAGGPGSNPRFNVGIVSAGGNGCESCHGVDYAHPQAWAGPNATFHYSADNIQNACTLCHGVSLDSVGGVGVSCIGCHASATDFTLDCTFCHAYPPDGSVFQDVPIPVPHGDVGLITLHGECFICHGMLEDSPGGRFSATTNYALFDKATDTIGDHWDGNINMSADFQYNQENFGCDAAGCHFNDPAHRLSDSGLPVILKNFFSGN